MHVVIFEDDLWSRLAPLSLSRPVFTLATGMSNLLEKQLRHLQPTRLTLWVRPEMAEYCQELLVPNLRTPTRINQPLDDERAVLVNARTLHFARYRVPEADAVVVDEPDRVRIAVTRHPGLTHTDALQQTDRWKSLLDLPRAEPQSRLVNAPWDLIAWNKESLAMDAREIHGLNNVESAGPYFLMNPKDIWEADGVKIEPGCVLDARDGPIVLGDNVTLGANVVVQGPAYIGAYTYIRPVSLIRPGTTIGNACKIGGEVSNSIILGYSNKSHDGYLGDSYLGKWVNLGALTTTSNLKNTYGEITVKMGATPDKHVPTGRMNLGSLIGDHTKTAILTRLMTGSYIGYGSMIGCSTIPPKFVRSFSFLTDKGEESYDVEKALSVARRSYDRRQTPWRDIDERILRYAARIAPIVEGVTTA